MTEQQLLRIAKRRLAILHHAPAPTAAQDGQAAKDHRTVVEGIVWIQAQKSRDWPSLTDPFRRPLPANLVPDDGTGLGSDHDVSAAARPTAIAVIHGARSPILEPVVRTETVTVGVRVARVGPQVGVGDAAVPAPVVVVRPAEMD